jgi:hypothetical protein
MCFAGDDADGQRHYRLDEASVRSDFSRVKSARVRRRYPIALVALYEKRARIEHRRVEWIAAIG